MLKTAIKGYGSVKKDAKIQAGTRYGAGLWNVA